MIPLHSSEQAGDHVGYGYLSSACNRDVGRLLAGLQLDWDLWHAMRGSKGSEIERLEPLRID